MNSLLRKNTNELTKKKNKGFTLVELIIVIAIIAILASIAIPKFGAIRETANVKSDIATAKTIQTAVITGITNGDIPLDANNNTTLNSGATVGNGNDLTDILEGGVVPKPKSKEGKAGTFYATITPGGLVTVYVTATPNVLQVLPTPDAPYK